MHGNPNIKFIVFIYSPILARGVVWRTELTPQSAVLSEQLTVPQPVKIFPAFYGTQMFITALTTARARSLQSPPSHRVSWEFILIILPFQVEVFQVISFLQVLQQNPEYTGPAPLTCIMPHPSHSSYFITRVIVLGSWCSEIELERGLSFIHTNSCTFSYNYVSVF